ncbi:PAS domain S-box-containing protein [Mucilaginibacter gossypiicola]|uniref:histidine kinase n=1 Tax=Mucilaginibacter gossypiicola TaxID=551995 RepID=A0A1H8D8I2_9SPHI|nr:PAS domain S-box protein [Mucilaginibacter gossypiicola]SEN03580.1 PAS domain S-box-containing protein [Mucilaginibacter gossypiicola]
MLNKQIRNEARYITVFVVHYMPDKPKLDKQAIAESHQRLQALVSATADVVYSLSADWEVMRELDGRGFLKDTDRPITGWRIRNVYADDMEMVNTRIAEAIREKKVFELEHRVNRADGTTGWTFSRAVPILDDQGEIIEWFGSASDITDRKMAEQALAESRDQSEEQRRVYEAIASNTPDLMYVFGLDYRFIYANGALLTMWGKTWENAVGKSLLENGYEPWHAEMHEREIDQVVATKRSVRGEVSFPHATLGKRVYDYILTPVLNAQGEVQAVAGTTRDVTERKLLEETLAQSAEEFQAINEEMAATNEEQLASNEELQAANQQLADLNLELTEARKKIEESETALRLAIDAANFGTWFIHSVTRQFITDRRLKELFGYYPDEDLSIEQALAQITDDYREFVTDKLEKAIYHGGDYDVTYSVIGLHDQRLRWLRAIGNLKADPSGAFSAFTGVVMDVTEQYLDEQRKNDFIGMVSHELKTPLTSLTAILQVLQIKLKRIEDPFVTEGLAKANLQTKKMSGMINSFLNVSRLESGKMQIDKQPFIIGDLIREAIAEVNLSSAHVIELQQCDKVVLLADHGKISSVMVNLLSNAVKYSPRGSSITVNCRQQDSAVQVSVSDEGLGIGAEDKKHIFERYYRVENNRSHHISGFGIGLYLSAEIIRRHQGTIWVESELGKGSTFYFTLPLIQAAGDQPK